MRDRSETLLIAAMAVFALTGVTAMVLNSPDPVLIIQPIDVGPVPVIQTEADGATWFQSVRQYCNPVEVETRMQWQPAPETDDGAMYEAACYALAGRIDDARKVILATVAIVLVIGAKQWRNWRNLGSFGHLSYMAFFITLSVSTLAAHHVIGILWGDIAAIHIFAELLEGVSMLFLLAAAWRLYSMSATFTR